MIKIIAESERERMKKEKMRMLKHMSENKAERERQKECN